MSRVYLILLVLFISYGNCEAFVDNNEVSINLGVKTYPFAGTVDGQVKFEKLLWDQRVASPWKFAMLQSRLTLASHGMAEAAISIMPLGLLEIGALGSTTSRFYETKNFDCTAVVCKGILRRSAVYGRALVGKEFSFANIFAFASYYKTILTTDDDSKPFVDEVEKIQGQAGQDELAARSVGFGIKKDDQTYLLIHRQAEFKNSLDRNESAYLIFRKALESYKVSAGLGQYQSNRFESGFSAVIGISYISGHSNALF